MAFDSLNFFKKIFGEKLIEDFKVELEKIQKSWLFHLEENERSHQEILKKFDEISKKLEKRK
jgi:uncharacterized protein (DUF433 family)